MLHYTDNPHLDYDRWIDDQEAEIAKIPDCVSCGEKIQEEKLWDIFGDIYCDECARKTFYKNTDDYVKE